MNFWKENNRRRLQALTMRFAGGSGAGEPGDPADPPKADPATDPKADPATDPPAKNYTYTEADLDAAKQAAVEAYKQHLEEAKDYDKMTPEEKVAFLEKQREDDRIAQYATTKLSAQELPLELLPFIKGKNEADTDERIKTFKTAYDKGVQAGVEKRFKGNGYLPRGSAAGDIEKDAPKRQRGVSVK